MGMDNHKAASAEERSGAKTTIRLDLLQRRTLDSIARQTACDIGAAVHLYHVVQALIGLQTGVAPKDQTSSAIMAKLIKGKQ
jgi:hypothetical protein